LKGGFLIKNIWKEGVLVRVGGSLSNYKTVLYYSLSSPGRSNLETHRIFNQEFVSTTPPNNIKREDENKGNSTKDFSMFTRNDQIIKRMEAELSNIKTSHSEQSENNIHRALSLFNNAMTNTPLYSGSYIDMYI
jgi:DNA-binding PadR family transcriptional regulator